MSRLVEEDHMDQKAASIVFKLDAIEDPDDLHVVVHHVIDGLKKLGILKRALAQEELFDEHKIDEGAVEGTPGPKRRGRPPGGGKKGVAIEPDMTNVTHIGDAAARVVAEAAGE